MPNLCTPTQATCPAQSSNCICICIWICVCIGECIYSWLRSICKANWLLFCLSMCVCVCVVRFNLKSLQIVHKWQSWRVPKPSPLSTCCHILVHILGPKDRGTAWPHRRYSGTTELVACVAFCLLLLHFAWRFVFDLCSLITFLYWLSCLVFSYIYIYIFLLFYFLVIVVNSLRKELLCFVAHSQFSLFNFYFSCSTAAL